MDRLEKAKELRAQAYRLESDLRQLSARLEDLKGEAEPLITSGGDFANEIHDVIGKLDEIRGLVSSAGTRLEGRERYDEADEPITATALIVVREVDLPPPDAQGVAAMLEAVEYAAEDGRWHGQLAADAAAWLVRQHPTMVETVRSLASAAAAPDGSESILFEAQMKP